MSIFNLQNRGTQNRGTQNRNPFSTCGACSDLQTKVTCESYERKLRAKVTKVTCEEGKTENEK